MRFGSLGVVNDLYLVWYKSGAVAGTDPDQAVTFTSEVSTATVPTGTGPVVWFGTMAPSGAFHVNASAAAYGALSGSFLQKLFTIAKNSGAIVHAGQVYPAFQMAPQSNAQEVVSTPTAILTSAPSSSTAPGTSSNTTSSAPSVPSVAPTSAAPLPVESSTPSVSLVSTPLTASEVATAAPSPDEVAPGDVPPPSNWLHWIVLGAGLLAALQ